MSSLKPAEKQLGKLDRKWQSAILNYLENTIANLEDPRVRGKELSGDKRGLWLYRVEDYRSICQIHDSRLLIVTLAIGHRKEIYRK